MAEKLKLSDIIPAAPERVFSAWLDPHEHTLMSGGHATDEGKGRFTAWDGYIEGRTVSAVPHSKIVQTWRTSEFPDEAPDSSLTILFEAVPKGTKVTFVHVKIPDGQADAYEQGWQDHYFTPMKAYFGSPMEQVREVRERVSRAVKEVTEEVLGAVEKARSRARKQAVKTLVKKKAKKSPKKKPARK